MYLSCGGQKTINLQVNLNSVPDASSFFVFFLKFLFGEIDGEKGRKIETLE